MFALADCNNFFVSCERVFRPDLEGKPVIVLSNNDGCAIARSNEAKMLGIKMGVPLFKIRDIIEKHDVTVFSGNMALYADMSRRIREVLHEFADPVEVYSIDEAFLDLRGMENKDLDSYAKEISRTCRRYTGIPVSVGIAPTKTLAKTASKLCKQYPKLQGGCYMYRREDTDKVLRKIAINEIWGLGRKSSEKLISAGICTAHEFTCLAESKVFSMLGITGVRTWKELAGIPCIGFEEGFEPKQSICVSRSFSSEIFDKDELTEQICNFASSLVEKLRKQNSATEEICVFASTNRFKENIIQHTGNEIITFDTPTSDYRIIIKKVSESVPKIIRRDAGYKRAGVIASKIIQENDIVPSLFDDETNMNKEHKITRALDIINSTFGKGTIKLAIQGSGEIKSFKEKQSPHYTTSWSDLPVVSVK